MKKGLKILTVVAGVLGLIVAGGLTYLFTAFPKVKPTEAELKIEATPERIERGKYLANHVAVCIDCHSERDWKYLSGPLVNGTEGQGGEIFPREFGFPGTFYAKNITPSALGSWSDGELYRAITAGVSKDGSPLFPVMPYLGYGQLDKEDIYSIIAYIRTLAPLKKEIPASEPDFPFSLIMRTIPQDPSHNSLPSKTDVGNYGKYLFTAAACNDCHTPTEKGAPIAGKELAGGFEFPLPGGIVRSSNITPDKATGIGSWSKELFISKFKFYANPQAKKIKVAEGGFNTIMPWTMYAGMTEDDLGAIYDYLMAQKPIRNEVVRYSPTK